MEGLLSIRELPIWIVFQFDFQMEGGRREGEDNSIGRHVLGRFGSQKVCCDFESSHAFAWQLREEVEVVCRLCLLSSEYECLNMSTTGLQ